MMVTCKCGHKIPEQDTSGNKFPKSLLDEMIKRHVIFDHNKKPTSKQKQHKQFS